MRMGYDASVITGKRTGVENYALRLLEALRRAPGDHNICPFSNQKVADIDNLIVEPSSLPLALWRQTVLPRLLRRARVTSLHSPLTAIPLRLSCPAVATVFDLASLTLPECYGLRERLTQRFWLKVALARATAVVCISTSTRDAVIRLFPGATAQLHTILSGAISLPLPLIQSAMEQTDSLPARLEAHGVRPPFVLCAGRIEHRKNPVRTLEAFITATSRPELQNHKLVFAGQPGNEADAVTAALKRNPDAARRIVMLGYVSTEEMVALHAKAKALLYLSLEEGFGYPPLEALALGTPAVAANIPVLREVLGEAAEFAPPTHVPAMADAIYRILTDQKRRDTILARGRERLAVLTWDAAAERILALHQSLTQPGR